MPIHFPSFGRASYNRGDMLTKQGCLARQARLRQALENSGLGLFVTGNYRTAYYFSGVAAAPETPVLFLQWTDGQAALATAADADVFGGEVVRLEGYSIERAIDHPFHDAAGALRGLLRRGAAPRRCAVELAATPAIFEAALRSVLPDAEIGDGSDMMLALRKKKEEDEIDEIRRSLACCGAAYTAARQAIRPGATELEVYQAMYAAATLEVGTSLDFPGDFACGQRAIRGGGPPTGRVLEVGDLYILDLFPAPALYFGDVCRTFAVGEPSALQVRAWELVREAQRIGESAVRPGVAARSVYRLVKEFLDSHAEGEKSFWHHAGHGIGHHGHEAPRIIPGSDDVFEAGDVFTLEPGLYSAALRGGIRLEDNYVLRESGLENLFAFPLEL
jgi:Xaa-Pro dipeptidase